ncbi:MAG: SUMF1/EgtB/PvdO family nonheme iron enzyme [Bacteroidota bacterium]
MQKTALFLLLALPYLLSAQRGGRDLAVFFPVTDYKGSWSPLPKTLLECQGIAKDLHDLYGFETETLANKTKNEIEDKLAELATRHYDPQDQLLLYFSMHGHFDDAGEGGCLVPYKGADDDPTARTWLLHSNLRYLVSRIPCEHILIAIDACYSGTFGGERSKPDPPAGPDCAAKIKNALGRKSHLYLAAGGKEKVPADSEFARRWRSALGSRGGEDGLLTFAELQLQLSDAEPAPKWGEFSGHLGGSFVFALKNGCAQAPPPPSDPETAACLSARRQNTPEAWDYYLDTYPKGRCADEARDERAWLLAKRRDTPAAYQMYLDSYPLGRHAKEVQKKPVRPDNMALIPGGTFTMGSTENEDEKPPHSVTVSDFYLGKYEVTVAEFRAFIEDKGNYITDAEKEDSSYAWNGTKWGWVRGVNWRHDYAGNPAPDDHPVAHVSWNDAVAYCAWLTQKTGLTYRLPTEAEWEYAAGNGAAHTKYSWGNGLPSSKKGGSVAEESGAAQFGWTKSETNIFLAYNDGFATAAPVGSFEANNFGLYDMSGNVWEWCNDWYGSDYYKNSPTKNPGGPATGSYRVLRGGSWNYYPQGCRVAFRSYYRPTSRLNGIGFRLARTK